MQIAKTSVTTMAVRVKSDKVRYTDAYIEAVYDYNTTAVEKDENGGYVATPHNTRFTFRTKRKVRKNFFFLSPLHLHKYLYKQLAKRQLIGN